MSDANEAELDWPLDAFQPGREVWYGLVGSKDGSAAFWYRYTLLSTTGGHREARLWAALTERGDASLFTTEAYSLTQLQQGTEGFRLELPGGELTSSSALGQIEGEPPASWELFWDPDPVTFTPLRSRHLTDQLARWAKTGKHWSRNQSIRVTGTASLGERTVRFEKAPGHQGHTVGPSAPEEWSWVQCNAFSGEEDLVLEALDVGGALSICLRRDGDVHALNRVAHVLVGNRTERHEVGDWRFRGRGAGLRLEAEVSAGGDWQRVAYLAGDGTPRYNAHCSLADVKVTYRADGRTRTAESDQARVEWGRKKPPLPGSYVPDWDRVLAR